MITTDNQLQALCDRLNRITGSPSAPYTKGADGKNRANVGCFHLSYEYGGVCLQRICNESGGANSPIGQGHVTKRELFARIHAFIRGIEFQREGAE